MKIAYFLSEYPALNITFILNEIYRMEQNGVDIDIYYEDPGQLDEIQPICKKIHARSFHINRAGKIQHNIFTVLMVQADLLIKYPIRYMCAVGMLLRLLNYSNIRNFILASLITKSVIESRAGLIYVHDADTITYLGLFCARFTGLPLGVAFHTYGLFSDQRYLRVKLAASDFAVFQSSYSRRYAYEFFGVRKKDLPPMYIVSSAGIDTNLFNLTQQYARRKNHNDVLHVICVARLESMKGMDRLIRAVRILIDKGIRTKCNIIGYGSQKKYLMNLIRTLRLTHYVTLTGPLGQTEKFRRFLSKADVFVLPSIVDSRGDRDMQPNAVKEAMAMKLPVFTTRLGGIEEVIEDGINGFLLPSSDSKTVVSYLEQYLSFSVSKKKAIGEKARETITRRYGAQKISEELLAVFQKHSSKGY